MIITFEISLLVVLRIPSSGSKLRIVPAILFNTLSWCKKTFSSSLSRYVVVENLRYVLSSYNSSAPMYFGVKFKPFVQQGYFSGGAGK